VNSKTKDSKRRKRSNEVHESFCVSADTEGNDDDEEELGETSLQNKKDNKKDDDEELPQSAFPYHKDLIFGTDHHEKVPFDHTDKSIEFICHNQNCHGLGFLLHEDFDEIQLDLLMIASWSILQQIHGKADPFLNEDTIEVLSNHHDTQNVFCYALPGEDVGATAQPSFLEATCKVQLLLNSSPSRD
jgi:hypothetical protein